jgi:aquaporin Z
MHSKLRFELNILSVNGYFTSRLYFFRKNLKPYFMKLYLTELIGTFFLVLTIGMTSIGGRGDLAPIAIGAVLMVMIYAGGHISGAHYNPAVTIAVLLRGKILLHDALRYIFAQLGGALIASLTVVYFLHDKIAFLQTSIVHPLPGLLAEFLGTVALCYVVLNVATAKATAGNNFYGLAIGFTVTAMAYCLGNISGGVFNPAVAIGISFMRMVEWSNIWIYIVGCFAASVAAAFIFKINNPEDN